MSDAADDPLPSGTLFGAYRIERRLGVGGVGAVYRATHLGLQKPVVLKVLHPQFAQSPNLRARFAREGRAAAAIRHPHVVDVTDVGEHQGTPYLIMELLEGESLGDLIARSGGLAPQRAVDLLLPVIAAVDAAHVAGVVHRDLKPDNLFVTRGVTGEPFPKVLDFGISRVVAGDDKHRTGTAAMLGTPAYMAPEQIERTRDADARSDQYALGVILYECLTGARAFEGDNVYAILKRVGDGRFTPPRDLRPALSSALEAIVLRAMSKDPAARFSSLSTMAAALLPFASDRTRAAWGPTFAPGAEHDARLTPSRAPPHAAFAPDTLVEAVHAQDSISRPEDRPNRKKTALVGLAIVCIATLTAVVFSRFDREPHPATSTAPSPVAMRSDRAQPVSPAVIASDVVVAAPAPTPAPPTAALASSAAPRDPTRRAPRRTRPAARAYGRTPPVTPSLIPDLPPR